MEAHGQEDQAGQDREERVDRGRGFLLGRAEDRAERQAELDRDDPAGDLDRLEAHRQDEAERQADDELDRRGQRGAAGCRR